MTNRLAGASSPYLLQHAENPVDWYPWGEEAFAEARRANKPIFLSIGYAACHWCHVMAHESFEDPQTADLMNRLFVNIKVDREERPELDNIYMSAVVALTGHGGWPMSVFLTPEGEPFYGGTYFPPSARYGMPSFRDVLVSIDRYWKEERQKVHENSQQLSNHIRQTFMVAQKSSKLQPEALDQAALALAQSYDWKFGGWGKAPKFPQAMAIDFLLNRANRGDTFALEIAEHSLKSMARGGMYDVVGGGFARYSTDDAWLVPHFEKMLYDNALLARAYLHAYLITKNSFYRRVCEQTLDFVLKEITHPLGGFYSSLDADSEGEEGKFYVWSLDELRAISPAEQDWQLFEQAYNLPAAGNFEGEIVLQRKNSDHELGELAGETIETVRQRLDDLHDRLYARRAERIWPGTDDKVLTAWNSLMLVAFSEAGRYLQRADYKQAAIKNAAFLLENLYQGQLLHRSWRLGKANHKAYLEDYAGLILGLLSLYQTDPQLRWYQSAVKLSEEMLAHFDDPQGGFFDTRDDHENLIARPKDYQDNATPAGNSLAATALLYLSALTGEGAYRDKAEQMLASVQEGAARYPTAFGNWLFAFDLAANPILEAALLFDAQAQEPSPLAIVLWERYRPNLVAAISSYPPAAEAPPLLQDRPLLQGQPTAYICRQFVCQQPVNDPVDLHRQLDTPHA